MDVTLPDLTTHNNNNIYIYIYIHYYYYYYYYHVYYAGKTSSGSLSSH